VPRSKSPSSAGVDDSTAIDHDTSHPTDTDPGDPDAAELVAHELPVALACGETTGTHVTLRNTGTATWNRDDGYKLGAVDDSDPFSEDGGWVPESGQVFFFLVSVLARSSFRTLAERTQLVRAVFP
jgi:hypothetical protein